MNASMYNYRLRSHIPYITWSNVWVKDHDTRPNKKEDVTILVRQNSYMGLVIIEQGKIEANIRADSSKKGKEPVMEVNAHIRVR